MRSQITGDAGGFGGAIGPAAEITRAVVADCEQRIAERDKPDFTEHAEGSLEDRG